MSRSLVAAILAMTLGAGTVGAADRVIALSPHLAELACAAGGCDKLVGAVAYSDFPEPVRALPKVGDAFAVNVEQVVALQPDLVLAWDGGTPRETQERLRGLGLEVRPIAIRRLEEIAAALGRIGALLGTREPAYRAAREFTARLERLRAAHVDDTRLRVMYQIEASPAYSINRDSPISQAMAVCGGVNVFADLPTLAAVVSREAVVARDPQVIIYSRHDDGAAVHALWRRSPPFAATRAGTLYEVDGDLLDRATPRLLDGVEQLCAALTDARAKLHAIGSRARPAPAPTPARRRTGSPTGD